MPSKSRSLSCPNLEFIQEVRYPTVKGDSSTNKFISKFCNLTAARTTTF
jgi:hypothetical protein